jgi:hypothetical protein
VRCIRIHNERPEAPETIREHWTSHSGIELPKNKQHKKMAEKTDFTVTILSQGVISEQFRNHALRLFVS